MALSKRLSLKRHADDESSEATSIKGSSKAPIPGSVLKRRNKGLSFLAMLGLGSLLLALLVLSTQIAALRDNHPLASFFGLGKEKTNKPTHSKLFKYFKKESKEHKKPAPPKKVAATNDYFDGAKSRIVAVGDFHGDWDSTFSVLKMAGLVDESENWIAGKTRFVQTVSYSRAWLFLKVFC